MAVFDRIKRTYQVIAIDLLGKSLDEALSQLKQDGFTEAEAAEIAYCFQGHGEISLYVNPSSIVDQIRSTLDLTTRINQRNYLGELVRKQMEG